MRSPAIPLSLYVHIPWCVRKCPYCDFNSHERNGDLPEQTYIDALLLDFERQQPHRQDRAIETIFIGGGTPSLFSPESLDRLLRGIEARAPLAKDAEITLEANPGTAEADRFSRYRNLGINRLSIGVQTFDPQILTAIGRIHDDAEAIAAARMAKSAGFETFNLDLMFGLPGQTQERAQRDIDQALELAPTHLSFYQLTLEPNTVFHKYPPRLPDEDVSWQIQEAAQSQLKEAGYLQYEVSAYAQTGAECRHNLNYWQFGDYLGIGAGSHGKITNMENGAVLRTQRLKQPQSYMKAIMEGMLPGSEALIEPQDLPFECLMNGLRLRQGLETHHFEARTGHSMTLLEPIVTDLVSQGLLERSATHLRCTAKGFNFLDTVLEHFLPATC
jgi:putative oxygen-independent coproporphyrinogen III oxidase